MEKNWLTILIFVLVAVPLIIFLVKRNQKDKKALVQKLNEDYKKPKEHEPEIDFEDK